MFGNSNDTDSLKQLVSEIKEYVRLQTEYTKLELTEKLSILLSTLIMVIVLIILGMVALFYLSFTLVYVLAPHVGGLVASFAIITAALLLLTLLTYLYREKLFLSPMIKFLSGLFLTSSKEKKGNANG